MSSYIFKNVYIKDYYTIAGPMEKDGKIKNFNEYLDDFYFGEKTFEQAEVKMQKNVVKNLIVRNDITENDVDFLIGGDLINQISISSYSHRAFDFPFLGIYSACSTFIEALLIGSIFTENYKHKNVICLTSSHNLTAERQFRYPVEYGSPKVHTSTFTATAAAGTILTHEKTNIKIDSATIGSVIDKGVNDVNHMGAVMAPAAADTLNKHLNNLSRDISYYDVILTGDLGIVGAKIFKEYTKKVYNINIKKTMDAGSEIFLDSQDTYAGGSGPACIPIVFFNKILQNKKYKKILLVGTGSLHSPCLINQHNTIPAISHVVSLEVA
ncbi:MAG: stage V sporulation protein AD [bacterium]